MESHILVVGALSCKVNSKVTRSTQAATGRGQPRVNCLEQLSEAVLVRGKQPNFIYYPSVYNAYGLVCNLYLL